MFPWPQYMASKRDGCGTAMTGSAAAVINAINNILLNQLFMSLNLTTHRFSTRQAGCKLFFILYRESEQSIRNTHLIGQIFFKRLLAVRRKLGWI